MRVVVARNHDHRHGRARDLAHRKAHRGFGHAARIEKIADDQQQVGAALVGDVDYGAERAPHAFAQGIAGRAGAEAVGLEVNVGGVEDVERSPRSVGQAFSPAVGAR